MGQLRLNGKTYGGGGSSADVQELENNLTASDNTMFRFGVTEDGQYGYIITDEAGADSVIPFKTGEGGSGEKELLWTNPKPTSAFVAQTLALDLRNYDGVLIQCNYTANVSHNGALPSPNTFSFIVKGTTARLIGSGNDTSTATGITGRVATVTDEGVTFTSGINVAGTQLNDGTCVPCYIWGVNLGGEKSADGMLRHDNASGYVQIYNTTLGTWKNLYKLKSFPLTRDYLVLDGYINDKANFESASSGGNAHVQEGVLGDGTVKLRVQTGAYSGAYASAGWKVDLTNATRVVFETLYKTATSSSTGYSIIGIQPEFKTTDSGWTMYKNTAFTNSTVELDVSELSGEYYVSICNRSSGSNMYGLAKNIYVE